MEQVFMNLLDNAVKYTDPGGSITVSMTREDGSVKTVVRDTGIGIPSKDLPRIFERFYRVDKARSREMGGTGLGLAIVKHIILQHGGGIRAESTLGEGTSIIFTLPVG
jgi:two-component system phosphate regulon sensor histidine kinase PhoR